MANRISKIFKETTVASEPILITTTTPGKESYSLNPAYEFNVYSALSVPRTSSSGDSSTLEVLLLDTPHSMMDTVWKGVDEGFFTVFVRGDSNFQTNTVLGYTVPKSWMDVTVSDPVEESFWYTPPDATAQDPSPNWDSGGVSAVKFSDDGEVAFSIKGDNVQVVVGLNEALGASAVTYTDITFGIYATRGEFRIIENGLMIGPSTAFTEATVFKITRIGGLVRYYVDDVLNYTSLSDPSLDDMVLDTSLYYGGDAILNASLTDLEVQSQAGGFQSVKCSSNLTHSYVSIDNEVQSGSQWIYSTSQLVEARTHVSTVESFSSTASITAEQPHGIAEGRGVFEPVSSLASDAPVGMGVASFQALESIANGAFLDVGIGGQTAYLHPLLGDATGLTGGNNLDTTASLEPLDGMAADHAYAEGIASFLPLDSEVLNYNDPMARPEVTIKIGSLQGSGTLLHTGRHILTAAHVIGDQAAYIYDAILEFYGASDFPLPRAKSITFHPDWDGDFHNGNDLAIIELKEFIPWARGIEPSTSIEDIGRNWTALSYSPRIDPVTGAVSTAGWDFYANTYDDNEVAINARLPGDFNVPADSMLAYDYDNGLAENDAFDVVLGIPGTGIDSEGIAQPGDSGSARVIDGKISGVASYGGSTGSSADINIDHNSTYGDFGFDVRVSYYSEWIGAVVGSLTFEDDPTIVVPGVAQVELTGFSTNIYSTAYDSFNYANLTSFDTEIGSYTGSIVNVTGPTFDIASTGTMDSFAVVNVGSFDTVINALGYGGAYGYADIDMRLGKEIVSFVGARCSVGGFESTITAAGLAGSLATVNLSGFTTSIVSSATAEDYGIAIIEPPFINTLYGIARLDGFNTEIIASNKLVVDNSIAYSINILSNETTIYTQYDFEYVVKLFGKHYGVKSDGFYLLEGADDNGVNIDVKIKTSVMDFKTALHKRVPFMYLDSNNDTLITPFVDDVRKTQNQSVFTGKRTPLGRGNKGRFWSFEVVNVNGNYFKLGSLEAYAQVLSRKV